MVEHVDVAARSRRDRGGGADLGAARPDAREVVAHAAAAAHGLGRFAQGLVDAGIAVRVHALDAVAHRLDEAVDQCGLQVGAGRAHDAARTDGAGPQVGAEQGLPVLALGFRFDRCQGPRHPLEQVLEIVFPRLEIFLLEHVPADRLHRQ
jgi:hypothetical protein